MGREFQEADEFEEVLVDLDEYQVEILSQLVEEGRLESISEGASLALEEFYCDSTDHDPRLEERISRINEIDFEAERPVITKFFNDTTYLVTEYAKMVNEQGDEEQVEELGDFLAALDQIVCPPRDPDYVDDILGIAEKYRDKFDEQTSGEDTPRAALVSHYQEKYDLDDMWMLLTS